jgi:hypothetical protein
MVGLGPGHHVHATKSVTFMHEIPKVVMHTFKNIFAKKIVEKLAFKYILRVFAQNLSIHYIGF